MIPSFIDDSRNDLSHKVLLFVTHQLETLQWGITFSVQIR